jgi:hypothetical protein
VPHGAWVGLASPVVRGEEDRELTFEVGDGAMGSGTTTGSGTMTGALPMVLRPKVGSAMRLARWGRRWCDGVEDGDGGRGRLQGHCRRRRGQRRGR